MTSKRWTVLLVIVTLALAVVAQQTNVTVGTVCAYQVNKVTADVVRVAISPLKFGVGVGLVLVGFFTVSMFALLRKRFYLQEDYKPTIQVAAFGDYGDSQVLDGFRTPKSWLGGGMDLCCGSRTPVPAYVYGRF